MFCTQYWQQLKNQAASVHSSSYNIDSNKFPDDSMFLRDKSVSCSHGLELAQRPTTVIGERTFSSLPECIVVTFSIGLGQNRNANASFKNDFKDEKAAVKKKVNFEDNKEKEVTVKKEEALLSLDAELNDGRSLSANSLASLTENIGFIDEGRDITDRTSMANDNVPNGVKDDVFADVHIQNIIKKFDEQKVITSFDLA